MAEVATHTEPMATSTRTATDWPDPVTYEGTFSEDVYDELAEVSYDELTAPDSVALEPLVGRFLRGIAGDSVPLTTLDPSHIAHPPPRNRRSPVTRRVMGAPHTPLQRF